MGNTVSLVEAARAAGAQLFWTRYEIFRQKYPQSPLDKAQYDHWPSGYSDWTEEDKELDWRPVDEVAALMRPGDEVIHYTSLGNVFLGTMLPAYLNVLGIRTVVLSGFHLDWCIEQAARTCRDLAHRGRGCLRLWSRGRRRSDPGTHQPVFRARADDRSSNRVVRAKPRCCIAAGGPGMIKRHLET